MIGRLLRKSDFERVLAVPPCSRSAHFALHHLLACPAPGQRTAGAMLSTSGAPNLSGSVDNFPASIWLGQVIPKRHAPRSVTRNMLRRQVRAAMERHAARLRPGMWLLRMRQPFPKAGFVSADSAALRQAAALELDRLFQRAAA